MHKFHIFFAIIIIFSFHLYLAAASEPVAVSISLKFEDSITKVKSLSDDPAFLLMPLHEVAQFFKIDVRWVPEQGEIFLSKDDAGTRLILGSSHALLESRYNGSILQPLSSSPQMLKGSVVIPPQDIVTVVSGLMPYYEISWDEAKAEIVAKTRDDVPQSDLQQGVEKFNLKTIVIDAGHGGHDPGANRRGIREKDIVLDIALRLKKEIESKSEWKVVMTRDSDFFVPLRGRTAIANRYPVASTIFISIHCNANRSSAPDGLETYLFGMKASDADAAELAKIENAEEQMDLAYILSRCYQIGNEIYNLEFARKVQSTLSKDLGLANRGVKRGPFYVIAWTKMPAILVELGFVSNSGDKEKLLRESFRQRAAESLFDAIRQFHGSTSKSLVKASANNANSE